MPPLIAVMGPTAVGKTSSAVELALALNGEVITCDSVQVYRDMDIGSAKPSALERKGVRHHLLDMEPAGGEYNSARYAADATAAILECQQRNKLPILAGGTGLYWRALRHGLIAAPGANQELRAELSAEENHRPGSLKRRLEQLDPVAAKAIEGNNLPRLIRDLEVCLTTGKRVSDLRAEHAFAPDKYPGALVVILDADNSWLRSRLEQREQEMLDAGLLSEIEELWARGIPRDWRVWRAVTYRQAIDYLEGRVTRADLVEHMVRANLQYARRQRTWFRKERGAVWLRVDRHETVLPHIQARLDNQCAPQ